MIAGMFNGGALPVLERVVQFTAARHRVLTNNIANLSTPGFRPAELDPTSFQQALAKAVKDRRSGPAGGPLRLRDTGQIAFRPDRIDVKPQPANDNILFHDQNNRDLERTMARLAENTMTHNAALELMRNQFDVLRTAIRERI